MDILPVSILHDFIFCKRFCYLKHVEKNIISTADIYAGNSLHETKTDEKFTIISEKLGISGEIDAIRHRDGWIVQEYKKGRSKGADAWENDKIQVVAYAMLLSEFKKCMVKEAYINYHENNISIRILITDELKKEVMEIISLCKKILVEKTRPNISNNQNLCAKCSLAPICLPEEERENNENINRLFPADDSNVSLHVVTAGAVVSKNGQLLTIYNKNKKSSISLMKLKSVTLHGYPSISTQILHSLMINGITVNFTTMSGKHLGTIYSSYGTAPIKKIKQYEALTDLKKCVYFAKLLVLNKIKNQLGFLNRLKKNEEKFENIISLIEKIKDVSSINTLLGIEGMAAKIYFKNIPNAIENNEYKPNGRTKRPPQDKFNTIISFLYTLLYNDTIGAILNNGLEPAFGFYHKNRHSALPLALDIMEIFRTPICDVIAIGTINKNWWNEFDFQIFKNKVLLSKSGKEKAIRFYNNRLEEKWKHSLFGYSLSYRRLIELEVKLFEKEINGGNNLFARSFFK